MSHSYTVANERKTLSQLYKEVKTKVWVKKEKVEGGEVKERKESYQMMGPLPVVPKKLRIPEIKKALGSLAGVKFVNSIVVKQTGPSDLVPDYGTVLTNMMQWTVGRGDQVMFRVIQTVARRLKVDKGEIKRVLNFVEGHYFGGGTIQGLLHRLSVGMEAGHKIRSFEVLDEDFEYLDRVLPVDRKLLPDLKSVQDLVTLEVDINSKAAAGSPFLSGVRKRQSSEEEPEVDAFTLIMEQAKLILDNSVDVETLLKFVDDRKDLFAALLKNKQENMERADFLLKVRPFYCFPGGVSLLFQAIIQPIQLALLNYVEESRSMCALKHVWSRGGVRRLSRWAEGQPHGFSALIYGDDNIWLIKNDHGVWVAAPDWRYMDMSLSTAWMPVFTKWLLRQYKGKLDKRWSALIALLVIMAMKTIVVTEGSITIQKGGSLSSGVVGTTIFDEIASAFVLKDMYHYDWLSFDTAEKIEKYSRSYCQMVKMKFGLVVKDETLKWFPWKPSVEPIPVKFLGYTGMEFKRKKKTYWVPYKPVEEWFAGACYLESDSQTDGTMKKTPELVKRVSSTFGRYFSGGFLDPWSRDSFKELYEVITQAEGAGFNQYAALMDDSFDFSELNGHIPALPSLDDMLEFYDGDMDFKMVIKPLTLVRDVEKQILSEPSVAGAEFSDLRTLVGIEEKKREAKVKGGKGSKSAQSWADLSDEETMSNLLKLSVESSSEESVVDDKEIKKMALPLQPAESKHIGQKPPDYKNRKAKLDRLARLKQRRAELFGLMKGFDARGKKFSADYRNVRRQLKSSGLLGISPEMESLEDFIDPDIEEETLALLDRIYDEEMDLLDKNKSRAEAREERYLLTGSEHRRVREEARVYISPSEDPDFKGLPAELEDEPDPELDNLED